ncbi:MAG: peptidylprolyl isomerase [Thaumarchaeota archaeon]|nr:peptidylprolyl isomerase [Nitrososphaerota archaeon]MDE1866381.1 peptidylprolyl isomerase [Nitrososphaerota archaeon]
MANSSSTTTGDTAVITTKYGDITLKLFNDVAPKTVANFEKLANSGFYNGTLFHRIVPGFVIQGGDPNSKAGSPDTWGTGDAGYTIPPEFSDLNFTSYTLGMARGQDVNSGSSQFFITVGDASFLNGKYTLFGQVTSGKDVVDKIAALPTNSNSQPANPDDARIITIKALSTNSTGK